MAGRCALLGKHGELELLALLAISLLVLPRDLSRLQRVQDTGCDEDQKLALLGRIDVLPKETPDDGDLAKDWNALVHGAPTVLHQSPHDGGLAIGH